MPPNMKELMEAQEKQYCNLTYKVEEGLYHSDMLMQENVFFKAAAFVCKDFNLEPKDMGEILAQEIKIWRNE